MNSIINKITSLLKLANHPNTPIDEAFAAYEIADQLVIKYNIDPFQFEDEEQNGN